MLNLDQRICLKGKLKSRLPHAKMASISTDGDLRALWSAWFGYLPMSHFHKVKP